MNSAFIYYSNLLLCKVFVKLSYGKYAAIEIFKSVTLVGRMNRIDVQTESEQN